MLPSRSSATRLLLLEILRERSMIVFTISTAVEGMQIDRGYISVIEFLEPVSFTCRTGLRPAEREI